MKRLTTTLVLLLATGSALAHDGHAAQGFASGVMHPLLGLDHWMAMAGLGLWSRAAGMPLRALFIVALGLALGAFVQPALPAVEPLLAASVLVAGLMGLGAARLPGWAGLVLAGGFSLAHGQAHGHELAGSAAALGAIGASLGLMGIGWLAAHRQRVLGPASALLALAGTGLLAVV
jgi:urease accessory protein